MSGVELIIIAAAGVIIVIGGVIKTIHKFKMCGCECEREIAKDDNVSQSFMQSIIQKLTPRKKQKATQQTNDIEIANVNVE